MPKTRSERRFERYLTGRGLRFEYEPDLGISFRPDYRVFGGDTETICEVKEFATHWLTDRISSIGSAGMDQVTRAVRKRVRRAAEQLADLAPRELPLVVVLSNPQQADVDLDPQVVWAGLYDDAGPMARGRADHISAVAILERRTAAQDWAEENVRRHRNPLDALLAAFRADEEGTVPEGERLFVTVLPTISASAAALPSSLFAGPEDTIWRPNTN
jgi:hypothetical protein